MNARVLWGAGLLALLCGSGLHAAQTDAARVQQRVAGARKNLESLTRFLTEKAKVDLLTKTFEEHHKLAADAHAFLYDNTKYAIPAKAFSGWNPYKDIQPGHEDMEKLVEPTVAKYGELMTLLTAAMGTRPETVGSAKGNKQAAHIRFYTLASALSTFEQWTPQFKVKYEAYQKAREELASTQTPDTDETKLTALLQALGELASGRYAEAKSAGAALSGLEKEFFRTVCEYEVLRWNRVNLHGHDANTQKGIEVMNLYRMSIDLRPLAHHPKLREMAQDFAQEQNTKKFFGHVHPSDPTRKNFGDRAKRVGYTAGTSENCASFGGDCVNSVWMWRTDAGHHRGMIGKSFNEVGLGAVSTAVLNPGNGKESEVLKLFF